MRVSESTTWADLFRSLSLTPGVAARPQSLSEIPSLESIEATGLGSATVDARLSYMASLLAPFFIPHVSWEDTFEVARAADSSPLMFQLFQRRHSVMPVLHLCKQLKSAPVLELATHGPKVLTQTVVRLLEGRPDDASEDQAEELRNFSTYWTVDPGKHASAIVDYCAAPSKDAALADHVIGLVEGLPAWGLLGQDRFPMRWAARQDEIAVVLKNAATADLEKRQRLAIRMMEEAIEVFDLNGFKNDASIARSNLANLLSKVRWLTVDDRRRRSMALYDTAIQGLERSEFRALLMDNIAGRLQEAAEAEMGDSGQQALDLSLSAAKELEELGAHERLPIVLFNVVGHLLSTRAEPVARARNLFTAREIGDRLLSMIDDVAFDPRVKGSVYRRLADVHLRSADYEPDKRRWAQSALQLLGNQDGLDDDRATDSAYIKAKAFELVDDVPAALERLAFVLEDIDRTPGHEKFHSEVLGARCRLLRKLHPRGDDIIITAARQAADFAKSADLSEDWISAETDLLQQQLFASSEGKIGSGDIDTQRAEAALAQVDATTSSALKLRAVLVSAYALRSIPMLDAGELESAITTTLEIQRSLNVHDRLSTYLNILSAWMRIVSATHASNTTAHRIENILSEFAASLSEALDSASEGEERQNLALAMECQPLVTAYAGAIGVRNIPGLGGMNLSAPELEALAARATETRTQSPAEWMKPLVFEVAGHKFSEQGRLEDAERAYRAALAACEGTASGPVLKAQIVESLFATFAARSPPRALRDIARLDRGAAGWTCHAEDLEEPEDMRQALLDFERDRIADAVRGGSLKMMSNESGSLEAVDPVKLDEFVSRGERKAIDDLGFELDGTEVLSETSTAVILTQGSLAGYALIVPPGARVSDALSVRLPDLTATQADRLVLGRTNGWLEALLAWRQGSSVRRFGAAIASISVRMWDMALGPVHEELDKLQCGDRVMLVTRGNQRLLPWTCAAPNVDLQRCAGDTWQLSSGLDLGNLLLARSRVRRTTPLVPDFSRGAELLTLGPLFGVPIDTAFRLATSPFERLDLLSVVDGTGDLPMTRLESLAASAALGRPGVVLEGALVQHFAGPLLMLMQRASVIHLACHGQWNPMQPWTCALMLGPEFAMFAVSLRARLRLLQSTVVLSACESGIGGIAAAGGGDLVQAFLLAGARSVVACAWKINDLSSLVFAEAMFRQLSTNNDVLAAARHARGATRDMSLEKLLASGERWKTSRPDMAATIDHAIQEASSLGDRPFLSPAHWGAHFVASTE